MSDIEIFEDSGSSGDQNSPFMEWTDANSIGWYLNLKTQKSAILHAATCQHKWKEHGSNTTHRKICSISSSALKKWADENGVKVNRCRDC